MNDMSNAGAASAAPAPGGPALPTSRMTVENRHAGLSVTSFRPGSDLALTDRCKKLFDAVKRSREGGPFVYGYDAESIFSRKAMVVAAQLDRQVVGTLHYHRSGADGVMLRGMAVHPRQSRNKLGSAMIATGLAHTPVVLGGVTMAECIVRELPDGSLNMPSVASFERLGFHLDDETGLAWLTASLEDRHMFDQAEEDGLGTVYVRYRRMTAGPDCFARANAFLAAWSQAILPVRRKRVGR